MFTKRLGVIVAMVVLLISSGTGLVWYGMQQAQDSKSSNEVPAVAFTHQDATEYEVLITASTTPWRAWFPITVPMKIGGVTVAASVAATPAEREQGLSDTTYLPAVVVKLFVFDSIGRYPFWMKDMNYPLDIFWIDEQSRVVHIEREVSPDTYPEVFAPEVEARYVVEAVAGFAQRYDIEVGSQVELPGI